MEHTRLEVSLYKGISQRRNAQKQDATLPPRRFTRRPYRRHVCRWQVQEQFFRIRRRRRHRRRVPYAIADSYVSRRSRTLLSDHHARERRPSARPAASISKAKGSLSCLGGNANRSRVSRLHPSRPTLDQVVDSDVGVFLASLIERWRDCKTLGYAGDTRPKRSRSSVCTILARCTNECLLRSIVE